MDSLADLVVSLRADFGDVEAQVAKLAAEFDVVFKQIGDAAKLPTEEFGHFSEAAQKIIKDQEEAEERAHELKGALEELQAGMEEGTVSAETVERATREYEAALHAAGEEVEEGNEKAKELIETLLEFAGIELTLEALKEIGAEMFELANSSEKASISIAALRGEAGETSERMEELHNTANTLGVSFEGLTRAEQHFAAFGLSVEQSRDAMHAAIEAAAALNSSVDTTANAITRLAISGAFGRRQLIAIGLSTEAVAKTMGVAEDQVTKLAKAMDFSGRLAVIDEALVHFDGTQEKVAQSFGGQWNALKERFDNVLEDIGGSVEKALVKMEKVYDYYKLFSNIVTGHKEQPTVEPIKESDTDRAKRLAEEVKESVAKAYEGIDEEGKKLIASIEEVQYKARMGFLPFVGPTLTQEMQNFASATDGAATAIKLFFTASLQQQNLKPMEAALPEINIDNLPMLDRINVAIDAMGQVSFSSGEKAKTAFQGVSLSLQTLEKDATNTLGALGKQTIEVLLHAKNMGEAFKAIGKDIENAIVGFAIKALEQLIEKQISNAAISKAIQIADHEAQVTIDAGNAAAAAAASVFATVPFPASLIAAGIAAAEAAAEVEGIGQAETGAHIPENMVAMLHAGETVLSAGQTSKLGAAIDGGAVSEIAGQANGGDTHIHINGATKSLMDEVWNYGVKQGRRSGVNW